jgi:hypothetical protein
MAWEVLARRAVALERQERAHRRSSWDHRRARQADRADDLVKAHLDEGRHEQKQPADLGAERPRREIEGAHVGDCRGVGTGAETALLLGAARQA